MALGLGLGQPVIMLLNSDTGKLQNLISTQTNISPVPTIKTYGAILLDNSQSTSNFFFSYLAADKMQIVSLFSKKTGSIGTNWNFEFKDESIL